MRITFITTVYNEEKTITAYINSIIKQTRFPDEIIITDGGSRDRTVGTINDQRSKIKDYKGKFKVLTKKGNRSIGRNEAIRKATGDIIVCSDAGNILDKNWIENITKPFKDKNVDVVSGYYKAITENIFQKCVVPYVLVMPDKVDPENFLPATRSLAFKKSIWKKIGGFPEEFSHNEDYVFANRLKNINTKIYFAKDAIVYWLPRNTYKEAFIMFFRFALGDAEANQFRWKVLFLLTRYIFGLILFIIFIYSNSPLILNSIFLILILYITWAIYKNYKYINDYRALYILPLLQFTADIAVLSGTLIGIFYKIRKNIFIFNY